MAKMGRPKVDILKDKYISIRVTPEEYEKIKAYTQSHNLTITEMVRIAIKKLIGTL